MNKLPKNSNGSLRPRTPLEVVFGGLLVALVALGLPIMALGQSSEQVPRPDQDKFESSSQTLRVGVWLDRGQVEVYKRGERIRVGFQTNEDAYAVVYRIDTEGLVSIIWPRDRLDDGFDLLAKRDVAIDLLAVHV